MRTLIVDDEPLAVERLQVLCDANRALEVVGTASDGAEALARIDDMAPDLVLLDMTMPGTDGLSVARRLADRKASPGTVPAIVFVTAHDDFAVEAFDLDAVDYLLKPATAERLARAVERAAERLRSRAGDADRSAPPGRWLEEMWVPHRSELVRVSMDEVDRIDAERDYVRLHLPDRSYLLLQTIAGLEERLDPDRFIRIHRSTILRKAAIAGLRHDGLGVWSAELADGTVLRIGRTYLSRVKAMAGR